MDWVLFVVVSAGWVLGFWLLNKLVNWLECRLTWWFHVLNEQSWLVMHESPYEKHERLDRELAEFVENERKRRGE